MSLHFSCENCALKFFATSLLCTDSKGSACASLPEGQRFQPRQGQGTSVPVSYLEKTTSSGFPVRHVAAATTAPGILHRRLASPWQRCWVNRTCPFHLNTSHFHLSSLPIVCAEVFVLWQHALISEHKEAERFSRLYLESPHGVE